MSPVIFHFITPVWGEKYTKQFLEVSLPCQLSPRNLGSFRDRTVSDKYNIYTTSEDAATIKAAPVFPKLLETIHTEIHLIDKDIEELKRNKENKYDLLTICHSRGIREALKEQAAFVSLCADMLFSDGSFASLQALVENGKRLVAVGSYRVVSDTFVPVLQEKFYSINDYTISVPPADFVELSLNHIHQDTKSACVNGASFCDHWPAHIYWQVPEGGIIQRGLHLHPLMIFPTSSHATLDPSAGMGIDGYDYMARAVPNYDDVYVVNDSDILTMVSLQAFDRFSAPYPYKFSTLQAASWIKKHCASYHVNFLKTKIRFHREKISPKWHKVEKDSDRVVANIFACLEFFDKMPEVYNEIETHRQSCSTQTNNRIIEIAITKREDAIAHFKLGLELNNQSKFKEAIEAFLHAIKLIPDDPDLYNHLGIALFQLKDIKRAEKVFLSAIKLSPAYVDAYVNLAEINSFNHNYNEAIKYLKKAVVIAPNDIEIIVTLGTLGQKLGNFEAQSIALDLLKNIAPEHDLIESIEQTLFDSSDIIR